MQEPLFDLKFRKAVRQSLQEFQIGGTRGGLPPLRTKLRASARPPRRQHPAAAFGRHPGAKTMTALAHQFARLIGPFHGDFSAARGDFARKSAVGAAYTQAVPARQSDRSNRWSGAIIRLLRGFSPQGQRGNADRAGRGRVGIRRRPIHLSGGLTRAVVRRIMGLLCRRGFWPAGGCGGLKSENGFPAVLTETPAHASRTDENCGCVSLDCEVRADRPMAVANFGMETPRLANE
jgi:hypothetical protein